MTDANGDEPCPFCRDAKWVCEAHPDRPWGIDGGCECGAPGMPCKICNPSGGIDDPPDLPLDFRVTKKILV